MDIFLPSFLSRKKTLVFAILFFLATLCINLPQTAFAQAGQGMGSTYLATTVERPVEECTNNLSWYKSVGAAFADILLWAPKQLAYWTTNLASWVISIVIDWPVTNVNSGDGAAKAFASGWASVRDLANMLIVLGFVIIGIATALRIREYEAKNLLWKLIVVALLINFSGLFCGLIIDGSRLTMTGLLPDGTNSMGWNFYLDVQKTEKNIACDAMTRNDFKAYVSADVMYGFIYLAIAACFLYLSLILIARYAILGILFILSPLAFVFWAFPFPKAKELWNKWIENFIKWAFMGVGICFFLNIAGNMLKNFPIGETHPDATPSTIIFYLAIVLTVIIAGIKISAKSSAIGAGAVMGLAGGAVGYAMGAVKNGAKVGGMAGLKKLSNVTGASTVGSYIGDRATAVAERIGLASHGTLAQRQKTRNKKASERINDLSTDEKARLANGWAYTPEQRANKEAAIRSLTADGDSDRLVDRDRAVAYVGARDPKGANAIRREFSKQDYRFAGAVGSDARQTQLETNWSSMSAGDKRNVNLRNEGFSNADAAAFVARNMSKGDIRNIRVAPDAATRAHYRNDIEPELRAIQAPYAAGGATPDPREHTRLQGLIDQLLSIVP